MFPLALVRVVVVIRRYEVQEIGFSLLYPKKKEVNMATKKPAAKKAAPKKKMTKKAAPKKSAAKKPAKKTAKKK